MIFFSVHFKAMMAIAAIMASVVGLGFLLLSLFSSDEQDNRVWACPPGYYLAQDNTTCVGVPGDPRLDWGCPEGYKLSEDRLSCLVKEQ